MVKLQIAQGELVYQGNFSSPAFGLVSSFVGLLDRLHTRMAEFGLQPSDLKLEPGASLAETALACSLTSLNAVARVRVGNVEAHFFDLRRVTNVQVSTIILETLQAVQEFVPELALKTHTINFSVHGRLEGATFEDFIRRYSAPGPEGLGPSLGSGVIYYYGPEADRENSFLVLERSAAISGGLFLRLGLTITGGRVPTQEAYTSVASYVKLTLQKLDLDLSVGG